MANKTVLEVVKERIENIENDRAEAVKELRKKIEECNILIDDAKKNITKAEQKIDAVMLQKATDQLRNAETQKGMYQGALSRWTDTEEPKLVDDQDSEEVLKSLLDYEKTLEEEYVQSLSKLLHAFIPVHEEYLATIKEVENTIKYWEKNIHPNYYSPTTTYSNGTHYSDKPIPVRNIMNPFDGCTESFETDVFLGTCDKMGLVEYKRKYFSIARSNALNVF